MLDLDFNLDFDFGGSWANDLDFNIGDFNKCYKEDGIGHERYTRPRVYAGIKHSVQYEHAIDFANDIEFTEGMREFAFVSGNFIFGDFLEALVDLGKIDIKRITIQTLSMSQDNIDSLRNLQLMCPHLESMQLILSAYWFGCEQNPVEGLVPYMYEQLDNDELFQVAFASIHTKIVTIETVAGNKLVIYGSANLRSSRNIEQISIEQDSSLYDFVEDFSTRIIEAYGTINHEVKRPQAIRGGTLWQAVQAKQKVERKRPAPVRASAEQLDRQTQKVME